MRSRDLNRIKNLSDIPDEEIQDEFLPIQRLKNSGYKVRKNKEGKVLVGVGHSLKDNEGGNILNNNVYRTIDEVKRLQFQYIDENLITDYNSLWELTKSGWNSDHKGKKYGEGIIYPYISVDNKWYRWDNTWLRGVMKIRKWTEKCNGKYSELLLKGENDILEPPTIISTGSSELEIDINKNGSCPCGSGLDFKGCCYLNEVGVS